MIELFLICLIGLLLVLSIVFGIMFVIEYFEKFKMVSLLIWRICFVCIGVGVRRSL